MKVEKIKILKRLIQINSELQALTKYYQENIMRTPKIKVKNINSFKYKKNDLMLNHFKDFIEDKVDIVVLLEQGNDILTINKNIEQKEYAIIKVYFKQKEEK